MSTATAPANTQSSSADRIGFSRLVFVELRKMFDTRAGFWLMASVLIVAALATVSVIAFVDGDDLSLALFASAFFTPMSVLLPIIAIMSVTSEWSQRTGLVTFVQVPNRAEVIAAKMVACVVVGATAIPLAFGIGAVGNLAGAAIKGVDPVWNVSWSIFVRIVLTNVLIMLIGFMLGALFRNTAVAIVLYFVYRFVIPGMFGFLAAFQKWFRDVLPWVDLNYSLGTLGSPVSMDGEEWAQLAVTGLIWFVIPMTAGIFLIMKSEVK